MKTDKSKGFSTKFRINKLRADLHDCDNFKIIIHDFTTEMIQKLQVIHEQFSDQFEDQVEFLFGKDFTKEHLVLLKSTLSNLTFRALHGKDFFINVDEKVHDIYQVLKCFQRHEIF